MQPLDMVDSEGIAAFRLRRRMSAPPPRPSPPRLPPCRPLSLSLEALDLSPASPTQALASLRFLVLSYLADLERRLSLLESAEWASTALDMLHSIRAEVRSHLPDLGAHLPDIDIDFKSHLPDIDLKSLFTRLDFSRPLSYVPTLSSHLRNLHAHLADADLTSFEFVRPSFDLPVLADVLDAFLDSFLAEIPRLPSLPLTACTLSEGDAAEKEEFARALVLSDNGRRLISYADLPVACRNNPFVTDGYRFIPLSRWHILLASVFSLHNEALNIYTHLIPLVLWGAAFAGVWVTPGEGAPNFFTLFALACLACSVLWHVMAGCAHRGVNETCARVDYVGIGWLIATSISTVVHHGYACAEAAAAIGAFLAYHPVGAACLLLCLVCGVSGNILPFCEWFNRVENRAWRVAFFVGLSLSALAPLAGIAALQGWDAMMRFVAPVGPSLVFYFVGLVFYAMQIPECFIGVNGRRGRLVHIAIDLCGAGSHAIWHVFIVFAMRAHRDGIREMRRAAEEGGCAAV
ncbi:hemolysin-III related-domain-containing protein, partial [Mycena pura]